MPGRRLIAVPARLARRVIATILALGLLVPASTALAAVRPAAVIDGPSRDLLEVGGVAMGPDGSGGIVYRKVESTRAHIFVSRFADGRWWPPQRVDVGQGFDSSWPRIAAGEGGRLIVSWVQEAGVGSDRLYAASLDPGSTRFERPAGIDLDVNESTGTWPAIAMNAAGQALIVYRVVTNPNVGGTAGLPLGYEGIEVRLARYNGQTWSALGVVSRRAETPVRPPDARSAPRLGIDAAGGGIVAFVEPDDQLVERVWARRVFSSSVGAAILASPATLDGRPAGPVDQFDLAVGAFSDGVVAWRQQPAASGPPGPPRMLVAQIPQLFAEGASAFAAPAFADASGTAGAADPAVAISPRAGAEVVFSRAGDPIATPIDDTGPRDLVKLGSGPGGGASATPLVGLGSDDRAVEAWRATAGDGPRVALRERTSADAGRTGQVAVTTGSPVRELELAGSGLGDGIAGFRQGEGDGTRIGAAWVDAPPASFAVLVPTGWVKPSAARFGWETAPNAIGGVRYAPVVDGQLRAGPPTARGYRLPARGLDDGRYAVAAQATDDAGQRTLTRPAQLRVDGTPPKVRVSWAGRRLVVAVDDGPRERGSGIASGATRVRFGDGRTATAARKARHRYRRGGTFRVSVATRDRAGNRQTVKLRVRVP